MKTKTVSQSAFLSLRIILSFGLCSAGVFLTLLGYGASSNPSTQTTISVPDVAGPVAEENEQFSPADSNGRFVQLIEFSEAGVLYRQQHVSGERFKANTPQVQAALNQMNAEQAAHIQTIASAIGRQPDVTHHFMVTHSGIATRLTPEEAQIVRMLPGVASVERERVYELDTFRSPFFIGADQIWNGTAVPGGVGTRGQGMVIADLDTGLVPTHPSFVNDASCGHGVGGAPNKLLSQLDCATTNGAGLCNGPTPNDTNGHGSHTGSTAGGNVVPTSAVPPPTNQIQGIAPCANIRMYKVCPTSSCPAANITAGINSVLLHADVDSMNFSISGGNSPWTDNDRRFLDLVNAGIVVSASAGNTSAGIPNPVGNVAHLGPWVMTVAASSKDAGGPGTGDNLANFSLRGPTSGTFQNLTKPDVTGPGVTIYAAVIANYGNLSGTSMSCPHMTGSAALLRALQPTWLPPEVKSALMMTSFNGGHKENGTTPWDPDDVGTGRVDLTQAAKAGLVMNETFANFLAANPATGGDPKTLNIPSVRNTTCTPSCVWTRTVRNTKTVPTSWTATGSAITPGFTVNVTPSTFNFTGNLAQTQVLTITATPTVNLTGAMAFGQVLFTETGAVSPNERITVAIKGMPTGTFTPTPTPTSSPVAPTPTATPGSTPTPPPPTPSPSASVGATPTPTASVAASATPCGSAVTFSNPAAIALTDCPSGCPAPQPASLYPSNITVSGVTGPVTKVTVTVTGYNHTFPADSDMLLVGPGGQKFILASDVIGGTDAVGINWTFDDTAAAFIGSTGTPASGTFKPSNYTTCQDIWPAPAPAGTYLSPGGIGTPCGSATLASFNGVDPNGTWSLYIADDANIDSGTISGGWSLSITTAGAGCPSPTPSATATPGTPSPTPSCPPTITQSSAQTITALNSVSCNNGTGHTDNSYWRAFTMSSFVGSNAYNVTSVSFGIEQATGAGGTQPVTVRLHTSNQPFPTGFPGSLTQIATATVNVPDSASNTVFTVPIAATVPANSQLVMEVFTPDGTVAGNLLFMGSNADPESGPSYLSAAGCGITAPTTTAAIGFPNMHLVFNVNGGCGGGPDPGTPTPTPTSTVPPPSATPSTTPCGGADVITDGGFENGGIPSSTWDPETSTNFGTPLCDDASCGTGGGASPPRTGLIWAWFGGIAAPETATIGQTVNIPSGGPATLHFWMRVGTVNAPFDDVMNVRVDGTIVQSFIEPATAETDYTERVIDLTSFANGASHVVLFEYIGTSSAVGSYVIDDVSLITGGCASPTPGITPTPSATIAPSPCPPAWTAGPNAPPVAILRAPGTYFPGNGRFYSIGGRSSDLAGSDFTNPFEYDPATNAWTTKPSTLPDAQVNNMACGVLTVSGTDQIYCVGGSQATIVGNASRVFSYNPATDTFTTLAAGDDWPGSQAGAFLPGGFAVAGNKLYIIGSFNANSVPPSMTAQVWQFDPTAAVGSKWLARADFPVARGYVPAATIGGIIYTGGGAALDPTGTLIDSVESFKYDPVANTWTPIANIPRATGETRAVVMNGQMWVLGGGRVAPNPGNQVDIYDPVANTWSAGLPFDAVGRRNFPADSDGTSRIFLAGGYDNAAVQVNTMRIFGPGPCASPSPTPPTTPTPSATVTPTTPTPTPPPATPTPSVTPPTGTPTPTPTPTPGLPTPTPGISPAAQPVNFSTRMHVEGGDRVGIGGFIVTGAAPKRVIVRAIGPSLTRNGLIDVLADPVLELHGPTGFITITNDNWRDTQEAEIQDTGLPPTNNLESAIVATLPPGNYTAIVRANGPTPLARSGLALVEVYDLNEGVGTLGNISTRAFCGTEDNIIIAGFILGNNGGDDNVIARGMGPSLAAQGVPSPLADPTLQLRDANGALLSSNNDWQDNPTQAAIISGAGLAPGNPLEAGIAATLPPGLYTALLAGLNGGTGIGLVEVYDRGATP